MRFIKVIAALLTVGGLAALVGYGYAIAQYMEERAKEHGI
jgi:cell division protein ZapA (FtsZ GTPase activity inhibitor)